MTETAVRIRRGDSIRAGGQSLSAGELVVKLHDTWGTRWLADRLISLVKGGENDWLEFKATVCPPAEHIERYSKDRGNRPKYVRGDYYLNVVKTIASFMNGHGGAVLLGLAQRRGSTPVPADHDRLCESSDHAPLPLDELGRAWDTDRWLLYVRNVFKENEWTDRYGTTWNSSTILDDPHVRLFNGVFQGRPIIVIAVLPTIDHPVELRRSVLVGHLPCNAKSSPDRGNCHWPHAAPDHIRPSVVPFRVWGDTASVTMKWSFAEVSAQWESRRPKQERFARLASEERQAFAAMPYGLPAALDSVLARTHNRAKQLMVSSSPRPKSYSCNIKDDDGEMRPLDDLALRHVPTRIACLTSPNGSPSVDGAFICYEGLKRHVFGATVPVLVSVTDDLDATALRHLRDEPDQFVISDLLGRFGGSACRREHWEHLIRNGGVHVVVNDFESVPHNLQPHFIRSITSFQREFTDSAITIAGLPSTDYAVTSLVRYQLVVTD